MCGRISWSSSARERPSRCIHSMRLEVDRRQAAPPAHSRSLFCALHKELLTEVSEGFILLLLLMARTPSATRAEFRLSSAQKTPVY